jgi:hypothetical protein
VVAPAGTRAVMLLSLHELTVAAIPLKVTVLLPCVAPKLVPEIVTEAPTDAAFGNKLIIIRDGITVNCTGLLPTPNSVTTTLPVVAPIGTVAVMLVEVHELNDDALVPLKVRWLALPRAGPKPVPVIVTVLPTTPDDGDRLAMFTFTVNETALLLCPATTTTTGPDTVSGTVTVMLLSLQLLAVAVAPPKVTTLLP